MISHRPWRGAVGVVALLALAVPSQAQGRPDGPSRPVCNMASPHFQGGGLVALDSPLTNPPARFTDDLSPLPGVGEGLVNAAAHSPALTLCGPADDGGDGDPVT